MYWVHRFGRGENGGYLNGIELQAACYLLEERNCLTVGWLRFSDKKSSGYNSNIVNAVETKNPNQVMNLMLDAGKNWEPKPITRGWARSLVNFTKMTPDDTVVVLPYEIDAVDEYFVVKIKSDAKSILNSPPNMTQSFTVNGFNYTFDSDSGWQGSIRPLDVGFFHEVEVLVKGSPRKAISDTFRYVRSTNAPVNDVSKQRYIESFKPKP